MIGYIDSSSFPVYTYGEMIVVTPYYIRWTPSDISSGTFSIDGSTYNFSDYSGEFLFYKNSITKSAFKENLDITRIDTDVNTIEQAAFENCYNLSEVSLSKVTSIAYRAFGSCSALSTAYIPECTIVAAQAFENCYNLSEVSLPNVTSIAYRAFFSCYNLSSVYLPECSTVGAQAFGMCSGLTSISLPKCKRLYSRALYNTSISEIYLPVCSNISSGVFYKCSYLNTITIGGSSVCRLLSSDAFTSTGITSSTGLIYVPDSLYESYRTDSVWSYFFSTLSPLSWSSYYVSWGPFGANGALYLCSDEIRRYYDIDAQPYLETRYVSGFDGFFNRAGGTTTWEYVETNANKISSICFSGNHSLSSIKLTNPSVTILESSTAFIYTDITRSTGSIMVPASLLSDYKSAYGWSYFFNRIFPYDVSRPYYMSWSPYLSGTFYMNDGTSYLFEECSGYLSTWASGMSSSCFKGKEVTRFETNFSYIPEDCFAGCSLLSVISLSKCERVEDGAFDGCSNLRVVNLPECDHVWYAAFYNCTQLYSVSLPKCTAIYYNAFNGCSNLTYISLPECALIGENALMNCYNLSSIVLPKCNIIDSGAFYRTGLQTITLGASSICSLRGSNVFYSTRISGIFVPSNLVDGYKSAQYWSQYSTIIYPINN